MPAEFKVQRQAMAIAEHHPGQLYARNRGLLKMTHKQLHDFTATKENRLPQRKAKGKGPTGPLSHALHARKRA